MREAALASSLDADRGFAIRSLLATPMLHAVNDPDGFSAVVRHRSWLVDWFDQTCGWPLTVDVTGRFARLVKRTAAPDASRPAKRARGSLQPFDRRRYELLCLVAAELASHPVTTIGILAGALAAAGPRRLDTSKHRERQAFVDALQLLASIGIVRFEGGDAESFVESVEGNALVIVDVGRLHRLPSSAVAPSRAHAASARDAIPVLVDEPHYRDPDGLEVEAGPQRARQSVARRVLDDPVVHLDELSDGERAYLANPSGRRWLRDRVREAGFVLEERAEGVLAVDPERLATDVQFPAPSSNSKQVALLLVDTFVRHRLGNRELVSSSRADVVRRVRRLLEDHPNWAKDYRADAAGPERLADAAIAQLRDLRLVEVAVDGDTITPRPAIARYAAAAIDDGSLFGTKEST